jgi:hypothetical protein
VSESEEECAVGPALAGGPGRGWLPAASASQFAGLRWAVQCLVGSEGGQCDVSSVMAFQPFVQSIHSLRLRLRLRGRGRAWCRALRPCLDAEFGRPNGYSAH